MAQGTADELLRKYNVQTADDLLSKYGAQPSVQPFAAPPQDFLQTKAPTSRDLQVKEPTDRGMTVPRGARALGRGLVQDAGGVAQAIDAINPFRIADKLLFGWADEDPEASNKLYPHVATPSQIEGIQSGLGLRPEERTGSPAERTLEMVGGLAPSLLPMGAAAEVGMGPKGIAAVGSLQAGATSYANGYYYAKAAGASEEDATKEAFAQGATGAATGALTSILPAKAISEIAKANAVTGGALMREILGQAALGGAVATGHAQASQAISRYFGTLAPEEQRTFLQSFQQEGVPAFLSQLVGQGVLSAIRVQQRSQMEQGASQQRRGELGQVEAQADQQIAGVEQAKGARREAGQQYAAGLGQPGAPLLPERAGSLQETIPLPAGDGYQAPQVEPAPVRENAPPQVESQYRRETAPRAVPPQAAQEPATATQAPVEAQVSSEVPAQPQAVQGGGGEPIKPETMRERTDRELGSVMAAWERVTRDQLEGKGTEARREPTYLGTAGQEENDPALRSLRQAGIESQAHKERTQQFYEPANKAVRDAGLTLDEIGDIAYARTALERNPRMARLNPNADPAQRNQLSGMSNEEANAILDKWKANPEQWAKIEKALTIFDRMNRTNLRRRVDAGLSSQEEVNAYPEQFYSPLRTNNPNEPLGVGRGGIRGRETQRALGRTSRADNPWVFAQVQDMQTTARIESNRTKRSAANLVRQINDPEFGQIVPQEDFVKRGLVPGKSKVVDGEKVKGKPVVGETYDADFLDKPEAVAFKEGGKQYALVMGKDYVPFATALRGTETITPGNIQNKWMSGVLRGLNAYSRFTKRVISKDNPFFWPINLFAYDTPTTFARQWSEKGLGFALREQMNAIRLIPDIISNGPVMQRFRAAGGEMPSFGVEDYDTHQKRIDSLIKSGESRGAFHQFVNAYERTGNLFENVHRVSMFDLATRAKEKGGLGMSDDRGALAGMEANINFARKGQLGPVIEATQPYYQAGTNAVRSFTKLVRGKHFQEVAISAALLGYALDRRNRTVAGQDDNGENSYDQLPQWQKDNYFILMKPDGQVGLSMPKPPGLAWLFNVGMYKSEADLGPGDGKSLALKSALNLVQNLSPINVAPSPQGAVSQIFPPVVRPAVEAAINRDRYGNPIVPENDAGRVQLPAKERMRKNTSEIVKKGVEASGADVSPSMIEHLLKGYLPGLLTEMGRVAEAGATGKAENLPLRRRLVVDANPYRTEQLFRERMELVATSVDQWKKLPPQERAAFHKAHPEIALKPMLDDYISQLREIPNDNEDAQHALKARFNRNFKAQMAKSGQSVSTPPPLVETRK